MTAREKFNVFGLWSCLTLVACLANGASAMMVIRGEFYHPTRLIYLQALGALTSYISVLQYFESTPLLFVVITTLRKGATKAGLYLCGVLPVFLGYAFSGMILFSGDSAFFSSLDQACVTLFALLNGDNIRASFDELFVIFPLVSRLYMYSFVLLFITAVLNVFIAIMEDSYFSSINTQDKYKGTGKDTHLAREHEPTVAEDLSAAQELHMAQADFILPPTAEVGSDFAVADGNAGKQPLESVVASPEPPSPRNRHASSAHASVPPSEPSTLPALDLGRAFVPGSSTFSLSPEPEPTPNQAHKRQSLAMRGVGRRDSVRKQKASERELRIDGGDRHAISRRFQSIEETGGNLLLDPSKDDQLATDSERDTYDSPSPRR